LVAGFLRNEWMETITKGKFGVHTGHGCSWQGKVMAAEYCTKDSRREATPLWYSVAIRLFNVGSISSGYRGMERRMRKRRKDGGRQRGEDVRDVGWSWQPRFGRALFT
jgi:hypothetical protein